MRTALAVILGLLFVLFLVGAIVSAIKWRRDPQAVVPEGGTSERTTAITSAIIAVICLILAGIAAPGSSSDPDADDRANVREGPTVARTTTAGTQTAATQTATVTTPAPAESDPTASTAPEPEPVVSGRLTEDEYDDLSRAADTFSNEALQFTTAIKGKCQTLFLAGQLDDGADCYTDAYKGLEARVPYTYTLYGDLANTRTGPCRRALLDLRNTFDQFFTALQRVKNLGESLSTDEQAGTYWATRMNTQQDRYNNRTGKALRTCAP